MKSFSWLGDKYCHLLITANKNAIKGTVSTCEISISGVGADHLATSTVFKEACAHENAHNLSALLVG